MQNKELQQHYADLLPADADRATAQVVRDLHRMYATAPVPAHINTAIARAVQQRAAEQAQRPVRGRTLFGGFGGWQLRTVGVVAALLLALVAGGTYAFAPVLNRAFEQGQAYDPGLQYVLDNHLYKDVDLAQTIDGYTVHLQRVYADTSRVIIGYTVSGPESNDNLEGYNLEATLTTASGVVLPMYGGGGAALEGGSLGTTQATVLMFDAAGIEGNPSELNLRLNANEIEVYAIDAPSPAPGEVGGPAKIVAGPLYFDFSVPFHGGQIVEAVQTVAVDAPFVEATRPLEDGTIEEVETVAPQPVAITLERLIVAPSETRLYLRFPDAEGIAGREWSAWPTFSGDDWTSEDFTTIMPDWTRPEGVNGDGFNSMMTREQNGVYEVTLPAPLHEKHGEWTISVPYISAANPGTMRSDGTYGTKLITGPWEFKFIVP